jgi:Na+:H+ antiporter
MKQASSNRLPPEADALRTLGFFGALTDEDLVRVKRIGRRKTFAAGETLVERGSDSGGMFVLLSGTVSVHAGGVKHQLGPGDFFGEMALLAGKDPPPPGSEFLR